MVVLTKNAILRHSG